MRGSVFKMKFRVLSGEFESIETSPGFAQLLGENWNWSHKKINNPDHVGKKFVKWQKSRSVSCNFTEKFELHNFWQEKWQKTEWTKILRTDSVRQKKTRNTHQCKCSWNGDAIKIFEKRNIVILGAKFGNAYVFSPDRHNCILGAVGAWAGLW